MWLLPHVTLQQRKKERSETAVQLMWANTFTHRYTCITKPFWQNGGITIFWILLSWNIANIRYNSYPGRTNNILDGFFVAHCNIIRTSSEAKVQKLICSKKMDRLKFWVTSPFCCTHSSLCHCFRESPAPFPDWRTFWMARFRILSTSITVSGWNPFPAGNHMLKFNNKNTRTRCEICSKLTIKKSKRHQWRRSGVFIVNFEHISHLVLFLLLTLSK